MRKLKKMKSMSKTVFALCIALSIFVGSSAIASASVAATTAACPHHENGLHYFTNHTRIGGGSDIHETHMHLYGYDANGHEVYKACTLTYHSEYCVMKCSCGEVQEGSRHLERDPVRHSVN